ncbi:hypothetical protein ABTL42_19565, partial [Acinetobacter baumannii]
MDAAQQMMQMIEEGSLTLDQGLMILRKLKHVRSEEEMEEILGALDEMDEDGERVVEISEILVAAGIVSTKEIEIATPL